MNFFRRLFDSRAREAYDAEAAGDLRRAAYAWAEIGEPERAVELLLRAGERASTLEERVRQWGDALSLVPPEHPAQRGAIEVRIALAYLESAKERGLVGLESRRHLADAAGRLERDGRWVDAGDAYELLGRDEDLARCLERAGDIERLEAVLERSHAVEHRAAQLRRLLAEHELAMRVGARVTARRALRDAIVAAPDEPQLAELLRRLEEQWPKPRRLRLEVDGQRVGVVGTLPVALGRTDVEIALRGGSVSRRHAELDRRGEHVVVRDLGSRNGTLVAGVPIAGELALSGPTEVGLGDDVGVRVSPGESGIAVEVTRGLDRGERIVVGRGALRIPGLGAQFTFEGDTAVLTADPDVELVLGAQRVSAPVELLVGDSLAVGGSRVTVLA